MSCWRAVILISSADEPAYRRLTHSPTLTLPLLVVICMSHATPSTPSPALSHTTCPWAPSFLPATQRTIFAVKTAAAAQNNTRRPKTHHSELGYYANKMSRPIITCLRATAADYATLTCIRTLGRFSYFFLRFSFCFFSSFL